MKKINSYRDKLLELASIYKISDIKNYTKNKKYLTTAQIEHILKKNKVPIPTEINKSILEIHSKKIIKPVNEVGSVIGNFVNSTVNVFLASIMFVVRAIRDCYNYIINSIFSFFSFLTKTIISALNNIYNFKVEERKANKAVTSVVTFMSIKIILICLNRGS